MKSGLVLGLQLLVASNATAAEFDRVCRNSYCEILSVQEGVVRFTDPLRTLELGKYVHAAQDLVPRYKAPIQSMLSPRGWRIVLSAFLEHTDEPQALLRVRFFGPGRKLQATAYDVLMALESVEVGRLFGGDDDILAITSNEEHSYNSQTQIWLLPERGVPMQLFGGNATFRRPSNVPGAVPGIWISRQTYDGVHAETKGWVDEFWIWDAKNKSLRQDRK